MRPFAAPTAGWPNSRMPRRIVPREAPVALADRCLGLVHLCGSLSAFSGIPRGGFDVDRCPLDGRLPHRLLLSGIFWVRRKAWVRRGGRRILFVNHNQAPIP